MLIRFFDIVLSLLGLCLGLPILALLLLIGFCDNGSPLFFQCRLGRNQRPFTLVKIRTMRLNTASVATHEVDFSVVTPFGRLLRRTKLDELPQLWNVLKGEMSLVGPRPCLSSQDDLVAQRAARNVFSVRPGITGLAQVEGIDMSTPCLLARTDAHMIKTFSVFNYFKYIVLTFLGNGAGDRVKKEHNHNS